MLERYFLTSHLVSLLVAFIAVYFLSFSPHPIMATNNLTTLQNPIDENSQISSTHNSSLHSLPVSGSQSNMVSEGYIVVQNNTNKNLASTEEYDKIKNCSPDTAKKQIP